MSLQSRIPRRHLHRGDQQMDAPSTLDFWYTENNFDRDSGIEAAIPTLIQSLRQSVMLNSRSMLPNPW